MSPLAARFGPTAAFLPHGTCINWEPALVLLQVASDGAIALAYYSIPLTLLYFLWRRPFGGYNWVLGLFALFILACGTTHVLEIVVLWEPLYWTQGWVKAGTAAVSLLTALLIWPLVPRVLALPTPQEMRQVNERLRGEVAVRSQAEQQLRGLQGHLEVLVQNRTAALEQATQQLQREAEQRERLGRFKDELVAIVSHELRTPLTSIDGSLRLLHTDETIAPHERRELAEIALRNCGRMVRLVNSLLDIDRIESGRMEFDFRPVSLPALAQAALREHEVFARQHDVHLELRPGEGLSVPADGERLMQVLANLVSNAIKHAPRGSTVEVAVQALPAAARITVADQGPGIPPEYREHVFDKFAQVPRGAAAPADGVGLGLSIARAIVLRHGGRIGIEGGTGRGTTFYVELPRERAQSAVGAALASDPVPAEAG
jgi:signal transduction histidine kinase